MPREVEILISPDGEVRMIHDDAVVQALRGGGMGRPSISRASHVEPTEDGRWTADLAPVGGPVLGPFETRAEALSAEHDWLVEHGIPTCVPCAAAQR